MKKTPFGTRKVLPEHRDMPTGQQVHRDGLEVGTLIYRSPEILGGSTAFGTSADLWSFGLTLAEAAGGDFHKWTGAVKQWTEVAYLRALFRQLGTPSSDSLRGLPHWPKEPPMFRAQPWPTDVAAALGLRGLELLEGFLRWSPVERWTAAAALQSPFLDSTRFALGGLGVAAEKSPRGLPRFAGHRSSWNILCGELPHEVLTWVRADPALCPGSAEWAALGVTFQGEGKDFKTELASKWICAGHLGRGCSSGTLCGLSLGKPLPVPRVRAWFLAYRELNKEAFALMTHRVRFRVRNRLSEEDRADNNVTSFMSADFADWLLNAGELTITKVSEEDPTEVTLEEACHLDGGASVLHMGLTLYGARTLRCEQVRRKKAEEKPEGGPWVRGGRCRGAGRGAEGRGLGGRGPVTPRRSGSPLRPRSRGHLRREPSGDRVHGKPDGALAPGRASSRETVESMFVSVGIRCGPQAFLRPAADADNE